MAAAIGYAAPERTWLGGVPFLAPTPLDQNQDTLSGETNMTSSFAYLKSSYSTRSLQMLAQP